MLPRSPIDDAEAWRTHLATICAIIRMTGRPCVSEEEFGYIVKHLNFVPGVEKRFYRPALRFHVRGGKNVVTPNYRIVDNPDNDVLAPFQNMGTIAEFHAHIGYTPAPTRRRGPGKARTSAGLETESSLSNSSAMTEESSALALGTPTEEPLARVSTTPPYAPPNVPPVQSPETPSEVPSAQTTAVPTGHSLTRVCFGDGKWHISLTTPFDIVTQSGLVLQGRIASNHSLPARALLAVPNSCSLIVCGSTPGPARLDLNVRIEGDSTVFVLTAPTDHAMVFTLASVWTQEAMCWTTNSSASTVDPHQLYLRAILPSNRNCQLVLHGVATC